MERDASREPFGFKMAILIGSTIGPTTLNKFSVTTLKHILTPSFITVDIFSIVIPYLLDQREFIIRPSVSLSLSRSGLVQID